MTTRMLRATIGSTQTPSSDWHGAPEIAKHVELLALSAPKYEAFGGHMKAITTVSVHEPIVSQIARAKIKDRRALRARGFLKADGTRVEDEPTVVPAPALVASDSGTDESDE